jgi:oxygen-independent coproporphyrinogen-3 oxidase
LKQNKIKKTPDGEAAEQFNFLDKKLKRLQYDHYEISNFALPGYLSIHNTNYWLGIPYLGIGPSAHSFNLDRRQYNINNNAKYVKIIKAGRIPATTDYLSTADRINEKILTGLRTKWGCNLVRIKEEFGVDLISLNRRYLQDLHEKGWITLRDGILILNEKGLLFADKIASDLFIIE